MPVVFVLIWSTGFVVARYAMPHAPPLKFLSMRFALSVLCLGLWALMSRARWPRDPWQWAHLAVLGALMQAAYLGGVWAAVRHGIAAGTVSLIVGLQPVLTAMWVATMGSPGQSRAVGRWQWLGLVLGLLGLVMVVWRKLGMGEITTLNFGLALFALSSITVGTLYQKRYLKHVDVRCAGFVQCLAALVVTLPLIALEAGPVDWHPEMLGALAWSVIVLTLGGSSLLYLLLQRGGAMSVTSLLYLTPPCTALMAWWLFDEALGPVVLLGMALTAIGVWLALREPAARIG